MNRRRKTAVIDADHQQLAHIVDRIGGVCRHAAPAQNGQCGQCSVGDAALCLSSILELGDHMMQLMLAHFHREDELMATLPDTRTTREHCQRHRSAHNRFTTWYNQAVTALGEHPPANGAKVLEEFVHEWIRSHALSFDAELASLIEQHDFA